MAYLTSKTISNPRFFIHNDYDSKDERDVRNSGIGTHLIDRDATDFYVMVKKEVIFFVYLKYIYTIQY